MLSDEPREARSLARQLREAEILVHCSSFESQLHTVPPVCSPKFPASLPGNGLLPVGTARFLPFLFPIRLSHRRFQAAFPD